jgi:hypothetical protein
VVEGIRALSIKGAPVLHTDVWFLYRRGLKKKKKKKKKKKNCIIFK